MKNLDPSSFSNLFRDIIYDSNEVNRVSLDIWNSYYIFTNPPDIDLDNYISYKVNKSDTLDGISHNYYGDSNLWWLVLMSNNVEDPFNFIEDVLDGNEGRDGKILLLKNEYVTDILFSVRMIKSTNDSMKDINERIDK